MAAILLQTIQKQVKMAAVLNVAILKPDFYNIQILNVFRFCLFGIWATTVLLFPLTKLSFNHNSEWYMTKILKIIRILTLVFWWHSKSETASRRVPTISICYMFDIWIHTVLNLVLNHPCTTFFKSIWHQIICKSKHAKNGWNWELLVLI